MNNLDKQYTDLLQDILDNGVTKSDRTGTGTISVFGRQIRHKMSDGFPLLTTKKMAWKSVVTELLWFLRGDTNIKFLVDNGCHIWDGDAYKNYCNQIPEYSKQFTMSKEEYIDKIKTDQMFAFKWGELGPIYGAQWRRWFPGGKDQIANLINDLKTNPDSRRLMVNAWNVGELDQMILPPCHFGFQVYTRELSLEERLQVWNIKFGFANEEQKNQFDPNVHLDTHGIPTRAISLMFNMRSVDTFLGLPFNIASYGLLLEIIAKAVNMVPDELIGNLGDTHLYSNHIEQAKEQIGRELSLEERHQLALPIWKEKYGPLADMMVMTNVDNTPYKIPKRTREPFPLPTLNINTEFWPYEGGECGVGPLDAVKVFESFKNETFCKCLLEEDIQLGNYVSHPSIKAPLSN
jgi:thymidylate synthase